MDVVFLALKRAAQDLFTRRMLALMLWPMGLALLLWSGLAWVFGAGWKLEIATFLATTPIQDLMHWVGAEWLLAYAAMFLIILLWLPAVYTTALLITALALMPAIVRQAEARHPSLERLQGGSLLGSLGNALLATGIYVVAWLVLLPVWLLAPFGILVSILLNAWLNQRLFMYDALAEHASREELDDLRHADAGRLYFLSALLGLLHFVPVINFFAPVYMGLAFAHYGLAGLAAKRGRL